MFAAYQTARRELRDEDIRLVEKSFHFADEYKRGFLDREDLKIALIAALGYKPSKYELDNILQNHGKLQSENDTLNENVEDDFVLDLASFRLVLFEKMKTWDIDEEVRETFKMLDTRCKGFIDFHDFEKVVKKFLPNQDSVNIQKMFAEADRDCDGRVSYRDFQLLMQSKS